MYTYAEEKYQFNVWEQNENKSDWVPTTIRDPPKFCNSSHFKRIEYLRKYFPVTDAKPTRLKDCLYYAILILPGAPPEYRDQGYIGIAGTTMTVRWSMHNAGSIVDRNLRLLQRYFDGKPFEEFSQYAAIFVLGRPTRDAGQKIELTAYESYLMNTDFCPVHGCRAAKSTQEPKRKSPEPKRKSPEPKRKSPRPQRKLEVMSECEETCQIKGCDAKCIRLTDMRYGMNSK